MDKINEALSKLLKPDEVGEVKAAVDAMIDEAKAELDAEYNEKLNEAYEKMATELKESEETGYKGYQEALTVIKDLQNRLETQKNEFDAALEEGYEEAYQMLQAEKTQKDSVETEVYGEYDKRLAEMREFFIDKIDAFFKLQGKEIYEQARRDVMNDPALAERAVTLNKVVETVSDYLADEDIALATSSKLQEAQRALDEMKSNQRMLEARCIRMDGQNKKLEEQVRQSADLIKEHASTSEKKARVEAGKNVTGRGTISPGKDGLVSEHSEEPKPAANQGPKTQVENITESELDAMWRLSGFNKPNNSQK